MWTSRNRARYDRSKLRYPSDVTDEEWELMVPLIPPGKSGGGKRTVIMREVVNGLMYVLSTGCQWRAIPKDILPTSKIEMEPFSSWRPCSGCFPFFKSCSPTVAIRDRNSAPRWPKFARI